MEEREMEEVEFFKVRPLGTEEKGFIITAGNMMASKKIRDTKRGRRIHQIKTIRFDIHTSSSSSKSNTNRK